MTKDNHIIQLDGIRFIAIVMVMIGHWIQWRWSNELLRHLNFSHGVVLFFVLSGFLISRILLKNRDLLLEEKHNMKSLFKAFYARRFLRIFPVYYFVIILLFVINFEGLMEYFPYLLTYTTNIYQYTNYTTSASFGHFWSLAVEEQFYIFWPLLILFIPKNKTLQLIISVIVVSMLFKAVTYFMHFNWMVFSYSTISNMYALGLGALLAYISLYKPNLYTKMTGLKYVLITSLFYLGMWYLSNEFNFSIYKNIFDGFVFALAATFIIARASVNGFQFLARVILENRFIVYSGKISYGMYIFHAFVPILYVYYNPIPRFSDLIAHNLSVNFIVFYLISFFISHLSWVIIERPLNRLKSRFGYVGKAS